MDHRHIITSEKADESRRQAEEVEGTGDEELETLKNRIRGHELFRLLIEKHIDCLKVSLGDDEDVQTTFEAADHENKECSANSQPSPDLDKLMELHCMTLGKLKEDMETELQETLSFISDMYLEIN